MLRQATQPLAAAVRLGGTRRIRLSLEDFEFDRLSSCPFRPAGQRTFASSASRRSYEDTIKNLMIRKDTKVICQGFTGKTVRATFISDAAFASYTGPGAEEVF